ncbi:Transposase DDE domain-containing protein [Armatimonadetes bacterium GBS]|nr:Transposase DDE domain-containing protein [Armatimonadetes bacterium GBS]
MRNKTPQRRTARPQEYPTEHWLQTLQPYLTPQQYTLLQYALRALLVIGALAQTRLCLWLGNRTGIAPNTWRQRFKRLRLHAFPEAPIFRTLLASVVAQLRLPRVLLALDATACGTRWVVLSVSVVVYRNAIPIAWRVLKGNHPEAWNPHWLALLKMLKGALPAHLPVWVLTDRGLWSPELFRAIVRNGWHPLMRIQAWGTFRPRWGRTAQAIASFCPEPGESVAVSGWAYGYGLRCTLIVCWGCEAKEPWYLLTDVSDAAWAGWWYGSRSWVEQGFRWLKRGGFGWHKCRLGSAVGVSWYWLGYAVGCLEVAQAGASCSGQGLWDRRRCSASVFLQGQMACGALWAGAMGFG